MNKKEYSKEVEFKIKQRKNKSRKGTYLEAKLRNPAFNKYEIAFWKIEDQNTIEIKKQLAKAYLENIIKLVEKEGVRPSRRDKTTLLKTLQERLNKAIPTKIQIIKEPKKEKKGLGLVPEEMIIKQAWIERKIEQLTSGNGIMIYAVENTYKELFFDALIGRPKTIKLKVLKESMKPLNRKIISNSMEYLISLGILRLTSRKSKLRTYSGMTHYMQLKFNRMTIEELLKILLKWKNKEMKTNENGDYTGKGFTIKKEQITGEKTSGEMKITQINIVITIHQQQKE